MPTSLLSLLKLIRHKKKFLKKCSLSILPILIDLDIENLHTYTSNKNNDLNWYHSYKLMFDVIFKYHMNTRHTQIPDASIFCSCFKPLFSTLSIYDASLSLPVRLHRTVTALLFPTLSCSL